MYKVLFSTQSSKYIKNLPAKIQKEVLLQFRIISENPFLNQLDIKKLKGVEKHYRLRISKYRFLYTILDNEIIVYCYKAGSRGDVYKGI